MSCPMLKMLGKEQFQNLLRRVAARLVARPSDETLMRRMTVRQEIQRLKVRLLSSGTV